MKLKVTLIFIFMSLSLALTNQFWLIFENHKLINFDFSIFIIILILSFLIAFKLSNYIINLKTKQNASIWDVLFLVIFFILLCVPASHIDNSTSSDDENRYFNKYKSITKDNKINYNYGTEFDEWFSDRFYLRKNLIYLYKWFVYKLSYRYVKYGEFVIDKQNKMMYSSWDVYQIPLKNMKKGVEILSKFSKFCEDNNIKLYVLVVPDKSSVYKPNNLSQSNNLEKYLDKVPKDDLKIIFPLDKFVKTSTNNKNFLYYKTEHHWTDDGAFLGYLSLMKLIKKDFPDVNIINMDDFNFYYNNKIQADWSNIEYRNGMTCLYTGIPDSICKKYLDVQYRYLRHKDARTLKITSIIDRKYLKKKEFEYKNGSNHRVIVLGTSMGENLVKFVPYSFKYTKRLRLNNVEGIPSEDEFKIFKYFKNEILDYKPDILIFCITYYNFNQLSDLFKEN